MYMYAYPAPKLPHCLFLLLPHRAVMKNAKLTPVSGVLHLPILLHGPAFPLDCYSVNPISFLFFFKSYLFLIEGELLYNIVSVSAIHQHISAVGIPLSPFYFLSKKKSYMVVKYT